MDSNLEAFRALDNVEDATADAQGGTVCIDVQEPGWDEG